MTVTWEAITAIAAIIGTASAFFAFLVNLMVRNTIHEQFIALREWASKEFATEKELTEIRRSFEVLHKRVTEIERRRDDEG